MAEATSDGLEEAAFELLQRFAENEVRATLEGVNDTIKVELTAVEFPPMALSVRPQELRVDGQEVVNANINERLRSVQEGETENLGDSVTVGRYQVETRGPGVDILSLELETDD